MSLDSKMENTNTQVELNEAGLPKVAPSQLNADGKLDSRTADQIEKDLVDEEVAKLNRTNVSYADSLAFYFQTHLPMYQSLLPRLSSKELRKLAEHVVTFPIGDSEPKFKNPDAEKALDLGLRLIHCKKLMELMIEDEKLQEAYKEEQKNQNPLDGFTVETTTERGTENV